MQGDVVNEFLRLWLAWRLPGWCPDEAPLDRAAVVLWTLASTAALIPVRITVSQGQLGHRDLDTTWG